MADYLKLLVPRQLVVSVVIVVNCQDYGVYEDDKNDEKEGNDKNDDKEEEKEEGND